jgi:hypothetical protein
MFDDLVQAADEHVRELLGELVTITRAENLEKLENVYVIIDRGVQINEGDVMTMGTLLSYWFAEVGELKENDIIEALDGAETWKARRKIESDGQMAIRILKPVV